MTMNERQREFLLKLADLCEEYGAEFYYKNDDDGIHIGADGYEVFVGYMLDPAKELRDAASA